MCLGWERWSMEMGAATLYPCCGAANTPGKPPGGYARDWYEEEGGGYAELGGTSTSATCEGRRWL